MTWNSLLLWHSNHNCAMYFQQQEPLIPEGLHSAFQEDEQIEEITIEDEHIEFNRKRRKITNQDTNEPHQQLSISSDVEKVLPASSVNLSTSCLVHTPTCGCNEISQDGCDSVDERASHASSKSLASCTESSPFSRYSIYTSDQQSCCISALDFLPHSVVDLHSSVTLEEEIVSVHERLDTGQNNHLTPEEFEMLNGQYFIFL